MFTGIVESIGTIKAIKNNEKSLRFTIKYPDFFDDVKIGDSISTNGVCLTVAKISGEGFDADVMAETLRRSNLGDLKVGSKVNLERAMQCNGRFGGHIVSGHIDGTGNILRYDKEDNAVWITIKADNNILKYIVKKGSISIDGVSLTVAYVDSEVFKVSIIPHTGQETTLLGKTSGEKVNLECDVIGKYVEKLLRLNNDHENEKAVSNIDEDFLKRNGFY